MNAITVRVICKLLLLHEDKMLNTISEIQNKVAVSVDEAAKMSSLSKPFLRNQIRAGKLRVVRPGNSRRVLILMSDFLNYLNGENDETK